MKNLIKILRLFGVFFVSAFQNCYLVGSEGRNYELVTQHRNYDQNDLENIIKVQSLYRGHQVRKHNVVSTSHVVLNQNAYQASNTHTNFLRYNSFSDDCKAKTCCYGTTFIVLAALGFGFGFGFAPHTYRVYNEGSSALNFHYRPGCSRRSCHTNSDGKKSCTTVETDCVRTLYPDDRTTIWTNGHLKKLCATKTFGGWKYECATYNGLQDSYNWCAGNNLKLYRCHGSENLNSTSANSHVADMQFSDKELEDMSLQAKATEEYVSNYLRGSSK